MDMEQFVKMNVPWSNEPCLYIVFQDFPGNDAYRCGASGTTLFKDADRPYRAEQASSSGLRSRCQLYLGFWTPLKGKIYAALRIKRALIANRDDRIGTDFVGNQFNVDRGSKTLVLHREMEFHGFLDQRGYRWQKERRNELFVPPKNDPKFLIAALRQVQGEELYLFNEDSIEEDVAYRGGSRKTQPFTLTQRRQTQARAVKDSAPTITIKVTKQALQELHKGNPQRFAQLLAFVQEVAKEESVEVRVPRATVEGVRAESPQSIINLVSATQKRLAHAERLREASEAQVPRSRQAVLDRIRQRFARQT